MEELHNGSSLLKAPSDKVNDDSEQDETTNTLFGHCWFEVQQQDHREVSVPESNAPNRNRVTDPTAERIMLNLEEGSGQMATHAKERRGGQGVQSCREQCWDVSNWKNAAFHPQGWVSRQFPWQAEDRSVW